MAENNQTKIPKFDSIDALTQFFDENDMGDYLENKPEVNFDVNLQRRSCFIAVDEELINRLSEISRQEHLPSETLVNSWLREKILDYSEKI